jgi:two-component system chemotaxis sensor kinase CheA
MRHRLLPLIDVRNVLKLGVGDCATGFVVVMQSGSQFFGAVVDNLFHTEEIVIKPMSSKLRHTGLFSGMTILGDGSVVLVVDPNVLAQSLGRVPSAGELPADAAQREPQSRKTAVSLLTFRAGSERPKAVPLALISRIEEVDCRKIEIADGCYIMQYRGQLIPLFCFDTQRIEKHAAQPVLVFSEQGRSVGLLIDEIVDIAEEPLDVKIAGERPGTLGYALINGVTTEIVDVGFFINRSSSLGYAA